jgi:hypothetical protein
MLSFKLSVAETKKCCPPLRLLRGGRREANYDSEARREKQESNIAGCKLWS